MTTRRHIIKGSSAQLPFVALNEHLCMQVASRVMPTAKTEVSSDGQALVVHRFDLDGKGLPHWGMEDFCALLGLRPAAKYDTTWERIARAVRDHVPGDRRLETFRQLTTVLLLTYALRNADCHAKNIALLFTSRADVHLAPAYDMVTTNVYAGLQHNPPGIGFMGKKTWTPGKTLQRFITATFGIQPKEQQQIVQAISDAVAEAGIPFLDLAANQIEFAKAVQAARIDSPRGAFTISKSNNPVQDFYLRQVVGKENKSVGIASKALADPGRGCKL